jgi:hypothetical protein
MQAAVQWLAIARIARMWSMRSRRWWKGERPIIPPRVVSAFRLVQAKRIDDQVVCPRDPIIKLLGRIVRFTILMQRRAIRPCS